eukprot:1159704-Pelagomonas_calceolata.AAC.3
MISGVSRSWHPSPFFNHHPLLHRNPALRAQEGISKSSTPSAATTYLSVGIGHALNATKTIPPDRKSNWTMRAPRSAVYGEFLPPSYHEQLQEDREDVNGDQERDERMAASVALSGSAEGCIEAHASAALMATSCSRTIIPPWAAPSMKRAALRVCVHACVCMSKT